MKKLIYFCIALLMLSTFVEAKTDQSSGDKIIGIYWSPKKDARIEIYKKDGKFFGKSIWTETRRKDLKNPKEVLRQRDLLGIDLFTNFVFNDGTYEDGKIYDPESGKTYDCKMTVNGNILKVRSFIGISLFGRTEIFQRVL
jgi:uncharacterized protein (DUF2147 family)